MKTIQKSTLGIYLLLTIIASSNCISASDAKVTQRISMYVTIGGKSIQTPIVIGLFGDNVPKTVANFVALCKGDKENSRGVKLAFAGSPFHRIIPGFMIQGGDFTNQNGTGGESIYGRIFKDENFNVRHAKGVIAMANSGPNTNGSQFFITTTDTTWLNGKHVVFGRVLSGQKTVDSLEADGTSSGRTHEKAVFERCECN